MCVYIYIKLNYFLVQQKLTNIVNQLYFNKKCFSVAAPLMSYTKLVLHKVTMLVTANRWIPFQHTKQSFLSQL